MVLGGWRGLDTDWRMVGLDLRMCQWEFGGYWRLDDLCLRAAILTLLAVDRSRSGPDSVVSLRTVLWTVWRRPAKTIG